MEKQENIHFRVPGNLKDDFVSACKSSGVSASKVHRALMRAFIERRVDLTSYKKY